MSGELTITFAEPVNPAWQDAQPDGWACFVNDVEIGVYAFPQTQVVHPVPANFGDEYRVATELTRGAERSMRSPETIVVQNTPPPLPDLQAPGAPTVSLVLLAGGGAPPPASAVDVQWALEPAAGSPYNFTSLAGNQGTEWTIGDNFDATLGAQVVDITQLGSGNADRGFGGFSDPASTATLFGSSSFHFRYLMYADVPGANAFWTPQERSFEYKFPDIRVNGGTGTDRIIGLIRGWNGAPFPDGGVNIALTIDGNTPVYPWDNGELASTQPAGATRGIAIAPRQWYWLECAYHTDNTMSIWIAAWDGTGTEYSEGSPSATGGTHSYSFANFAAGPTSYSWGYRNHRADALDETVFYGPGGLALNNGFIGPVAVTSLA